VIGPIIFPGNVLYMKHLNNNGRNLYKIFSLKGDIGEKAGC
jgi:hypothetical protein